MGELDRLEQELVADLLRSWVDVYDQAQAIYDGLPAETKQWIDDHGHRVESLVSVIVNMQPDVRVVCRSLVEDGLKATEDSLSQATPSIEHTVEQSAARAKSGGEKMGGVEDRITALEERAERLERMLDAALTSSDEGDARSSPRAGRSEPQGG